MSKDQPSGGGQSAGKKNRKIFLICLGHGLRSSREPSKEKKKGTIVHRRIYGSTQDRDHTRIQSAGKKIEQQQGMEKIRRE